MDLKSEHPQHLDSRGADSPPALEKADYDGKDGYRNPALEGFTDADHKRIKRKIDVRLVLTLGLMYCVSLMDRTNRTCAQVRTSQTVRRSQPGWGFPHDEATSCNVR